MTKSSTELMAEFQKKYPEAGKDPLLKKIFEIFEAEIRMEQKDLIEFLRNQASDLNQYVINLKARIKKYE